MRELLSGSFSFSFTLVSLYTSLKAFDFDWNCPPFLTSVQESKKPIMKLKDFEETFLTQGREAG